jgi:voltage-gated potassium channel
MSAPGERLRRRVYLMLEGGSAAGALGAGIEILLVVLIALNVAAFILQSVPAVERVYGRLFAGFEVVSVAIFTVEYALRLWASAEDPTIAGRGDAGARIRAALRPMMVIDLLSFAPAYVALFVPFLDLRALRLFRLLRLLKIARYSPALSTLARVIIDERRALFGTLLLLLCATILAGATMHMVEGAVQPRRFGTIPDAMWWAISTLTTVGYGDSVPITLAGRMVASLTMIVGLGLFALPVGIVATGFVDSIHRREFVVTFGMLARVPLFANFGAQTVGEIMALLRAQAVGAGTIISAEGERAAAMYFVIAGEVEAQLRERRLRFGAGDFFGELALLHETMRAATIVALTPARVLSLSTDDFESLLRKNPDLRDSIRRATAAHVEDVALAGGISQAEIDAAHRARAEPASDG